MDPAEPNTASITGNEENRSTGKTKRDRGRGKNRGGGGGGGGRGKNNKDQSNAKDIAEKTRRQRRRERQQRRAQNKQQKREIRLEPYNDNRYYRDRTCYDGPFRKFRDNPPNHNDYDRHHYSHERSNQGFMPSYNSSEPNLPGLDSTPLNVPTLPAVTTQEKKPESSSSSSSSSDESEDSIVKSLKNEVKQAENAVEERVSQVSLDNTAVILPQRPKRPTQKPPTKVKAEHNSKSSESSTLDDSSSSSEEETSKHKKPPSVEDVICLGNLEKFEDLVEDEEVSVSNPCVLCDKMGHISFHCQMICKNCNGKYHGLKDCPKPANLSVVFSNFIEFCLKQSCRYNPNADFPVDISGERLARSGGFPVSGNGELQKIEKSSRSSVPKANRKRQKSSSSCSSESDVESSPTRKRKRRSKKVEGPSPSVTIPFTVPFPPAYNSSFGFGPSGAVNPLLAFSHMMGYNPTQIDFRGNMHGKE